MSGGLVDVTTRATVDLTVRLRWEGAHRLAHRPGKCAYLHGHSWQAWATFTGDPGVAGMVADFSALKYAMQGWVDEHLDHAVMLGVEDPMTDVLTHYGMRVFPFGDLDLAPGLPWPTVENVAALLLGQAVAVAAVSGVEAVEVTVAETENNQATARVPTGDTAALVEQLAETATELGRHLAHTDDPDAGSAR